MKGEVKMNLFKNKALVLFGTLFLFGMETIFRNRKKSVGFRGLTLASGSLGLADILAHHSLAVRPWAKFLTSLSVISSAIK